MKTSTLKRIKLRQTEPVAEGLLLMVGVLATVMTVSNAERIM
jgi:hypothetical protein